MAFRKSVIKYEVVYDDEFTNLDCLSLEDIHYETTEGFASGMFLDSDEKILDEKEAFEALEKLGSDPEFLNLYKCHNCGKIFKGNELFDYNCKECS